MPSPLVNRYAIYFELPDHGKVPQSIAREPSLLMAVENCLNTYQATGHTGFAIDDTRAHREFHVQRDILLPEPVGPARGPGRARFVPRRARPNVNRRVGLLCPRGPSKGI